MIPAVRGWATEALPHGILMTHPGGKQVATIAYRERARPLLPVGPLLHNVLARTPRWVTERVGPVERLVTHDGEHGALVTVTGTQDGAPAHRDFGFVFGDDFFSSVGGLCLLKGLRLELTAVCGKNGRLMRRLQELAGSLPPGVTLDVLGYTDQIPQLMKAADVLITKAGPSTLFEAVACQLPAILTAHLPSRHLRS